jgi:hypothetical protein
MYFSMLNAGMVVPLTLMLDSINGGARSAGTRLGFPAAVAALGLSNTHISPLGAWNG